jgi:hypothetical protein
VNHTQRGDDAHRLITREHVGIELAGQALQRHPRGSECVEHLFASYRSGVTLNPEFVNHFRSYFASPLGSLR